LRIIIDCGFCSICYCNLRGEKLLICALNSLSTQNRNSALNVIENWRDKKLEISVEVKSALQKLKKVEVNEKLKERLRNF